MIPLICYRQGIDTLQLLAGPDTALTADTFAVVFLNRRGEAIDLIVLNVTQVQQEVIAHTEFIGKILQFALPVLITFGTIGIMLRKKQLYNVLPGRTHL